MTTSSTTAVLFFGSVVSLALPARPQQTKATASTTQTTAPAQQSKSTAVHANPDKRQILVTSGILSLLSSSEADLVTGDASGHPITLTFLCDQNTKEDKASKGDGVNILYVANGRSNLALAIHLIQSAGGTKGSPGEVGGVAKAEPTRATGSSGEIGGIASASPPPPAYSLSPSDAQSLQKKLEGDFGLTVADGNTKPAYGRIVTLKNHDLAASLSSDITPWNIYVNGGIQTDLYGTITTTATGGSSSFGSLLPGLTHKPPSEQTPQYVFTPGDTLEVVDVEVDGNSVLLKLAAERPAHRSSTGAFSSAVGSTTQRRVYSTLAFPITSDDTPPANTVEQQIAQFLDPKSPSVYSAGQGTTVGTHAPAAASAAPAAAAPPAPAAAPAASAEAPAAQAPAPAAASAAPAAQATIALGQTQKQVIEVLGEPPKIVKLNEREIYIYKDLKITFVKGKVTDVQ
jgi:hypothetical protein